MQVSPLCALQPLIMPLKDFCLSLWAHFVPISLCIMLYSDYLLPFVGLLFALQPL